MFCWAKTHNKALEKRRAKNARVSLCFRIQTMERSLRDDEYFVIEALCSSYDGTWRTGEDPPDAYMMLNDHEIAVEISILTQHVVCESGESVPRLSQDSGVLRLCDEVNVEE